MKKKQILRATKKREEKAAKAYARLAATEAIASKARAEARRDALSEMVAFAISSAVHETEATEQGQDVGASRQGREILESYVRLEREHLHLLREYRMTLEEYADLLSSIGCKYVIPDPEDENYGFDTKEDKEGDDAFGTEPRCEDFPNGWDGD